jgi:3D (Asp-Asp-Asp) domain-containing protein
VLAVATPPAYVGHPFIHHHPKTEQQRLHRYQVTHHAAAFYTLTVWETAYCLGGDSRNATTATGATVAYGIIAVDPNLIPLHSRVYVPGYGFARAEDTGGAIIGHRIDVWTLCKYADHWPNHYVTIRVYRGA